MLKKQDHPEMFPPITLVLVAILLILNLVAMVRVRSQEGAESRLREELARGRQQQAEESRALREELSANVQRFAQQAELRAESLRSALMQNVVELQRGQRTELERNRETVETKLAAMSEAQAEESRGLREELATGARRAAAEAETRAEVLRTSMTQSLAELQREQRLELEKSRATVEQKLAAIQQDNALKLEQIRKTSEMQAEESRTLRDELAASARRTAGEAELRAEVLRTSLAQNLAELQKEQRIELEKSRATVEHKLGAIQQDNAAKLEQMRQTVDEKLQSTLETRLGESFRIVSDRLEQVHKGLGEMQSLASGVGDLKKVLTNVTTRGAWGEVQLENLLTQMLAPDQFARNVSTAGNGERVEFAIKLPGPGASPVWLPVDAKFPSETYQRLAHAAERGDAEGVEACSRELEGVVRACAKTFSTKYLAPPNTTDFGILFLATEGLYAEALRRPGLAESLQETYRVVLAGPTTFAALLNSLQMGFRTLAIQQRSGEVWTLLGEVKTQFGKYSQVLDVIRKRLDQATQTVDDAAIRTRAIEKRLRSVEDTEEPEQARLIRLAV